MAPDLELISQRGEKISLSQFNGRPVVLFFYPKDFTPGCTKEACTFRDNFEAFKDAGAEVIGISSDSPKSHADFADKYNLPFLLLSDELGAARRGFGVPSTAGIMPGRVTYVIDRLGVVRHIFVSQTQAEKHVEEALRILRLL